MTKCCGTCKRWKQDFQENRPKSLRTFGYGICRLNEATYKAKDMVNCMGWKEADPWDIESREKQGII